MQTASNDTKDAWRAGSTASAAPRRVLRLGLASIALLAGALGSGWLLAQAWVAARARVAAPGPASVDELVSLLAATLAGAVTAWLLCGIVLELAGHLPGRVGGAAARCSQRVTPALARRVAGFVLGVGVGVVGGPAQALATDGSGPAAVTAAQAGRADMIQAGVRPVVRPGEGQAPDPGFRVATAGDPTTPSTSTGGPRTAESAPAPSARAEPVTPGFTPSPPRVRPQADPGLLGARVAVRDTARDVDEVVVHRGDTLWSIAARHLGPDASAAEIDRSWRRWFTLNHDRVGADPDLILPGQVLRVPGPEAHAGAAR